VREIEGFKGKGRDSREWMIGKGMDEFEWKG